MVTYGRSLPGEASPGELRGKSDQEIAVPVVNERDKQTYYGAIDYLQGKLVLKAYDAGNSKNTIDYLQYLLADSPDQQLLIFWDGACYHRSVICSRFFGRGKSRVVIGTMENTLHSLCSQLPSTNPIEDVWLQAKTWVRRFCALIPSFSHLKWMEEVVYPTHYL